eukprot:SAG11_NODE_11142_length_781_cov_1.266862_1_plen_145_part_00
MATAVAALEGGGGGGGRRRGALAIEVMSDGNLTPQVRLCVLCAASLPQRAVSRPEARAREREGGAPLQLYMLGLAALAARRPVWGSALIYELHYRQRPFPAAAPDFAVRVIYNGAAQARPRPAPSLQPPAPASASAPRRRRRLG